ncbi:MAG: 3-dehydroquinate synthase [Acidaminococcaceae bacterium]|nr:3-dehydroquinate synthase [Acidaminococcaceae bacterium]
MRNVHVDLGLKSYEIEIERGLLPRLGRKIKTLLPKAEKAAVITDSNVGPLYASVLKKSLEKEGIAVTVLTFKAGEESKNLQTLGTLYDGLAEAGLTRSDAVIALGGGVTGDMGGLAAATFLRGVAFIQIPSSLLATVDSSVGGKVAVDLPSGKNLVGAFYQPKAVYIDPDLLKTLPVRYLHDGLAEVIKYGCIRDRDLFVTLENIQNDAELLNRADEIIETCCNIKARIVEQDEFDNGERMLLNFGHTLGHAVEKTFHFDRYSHGEGVSIGMVLLTRQSEKLGLTEYGTADRIAALLQKFQLPVNVKMRQDDFLRAIALDKKKRGSSLTLILLKKIGDSFLQKVAFSNLPDFLPGK